MLYTLASGVTFSVNGAEKCLSRCGFCLKLWLQFHYSPNFDNNLCLTLFIS